MYFIHYDTSLARFADFKNQSYSSQNGFIVFNLVKVQFSSQKGLEKSWCGLQGGGMLMIFKSDVLSLQVQSFLLQTQLGI